MSNVQQVTQQLRAIPPAKRRRKAWQTIAGVLLAAGGLFVPRFLGYPWQVGAVLSSFGAFIASKELVVAYARFVPAALRDLLAPPKAGA